MNAPDPLLEALLPDLLVVEDLAGRLRRSPSAVRALLRAGALPGRKVGRRWVVEREALLQALAPEREPLPLRVLGSEEGDEP
ncbi:MAG TPA: helix-turn-helix domain-containing protein [Planctomycetota bacterium]|jgi:hypothetical protein|nr:helix-turn-helix domain-containing protein [Planctomycetota bacterium]